MLVIRLSRHGRKNLAVYRVVLSEHTKPVKYWYKEVLGSYDPIQHELKVDVESIVSWIKKWAQPSERVAKLLFNQTKDEFFNKFIEQRERKWITKKEEKK